MSATDPPAVELADLVPQKGRSFLLDQLVEHGDASTRCTVEVTRDAWLARGEGVPSWLAIEYIAQCVAAREGLRARSEGRPLAMGWLAGAPELQFHCSHFAPGERLWVDVRHLRGRPELGAVAYRGVVSRAEEPDRPLVEGALTLAVVAPPHPA